MILKFQFIAIIIILLGSILASQANTFKPFIRSRYSIRWRKTTETSNIWDSSTASVLKESVEKSSIKSTQMANSLTDSTMQLTTPLTLIKTSTHSPDYDYYNNELEEAEHKN